MHTGRRRDMANEIACDDLVKGCPFTATAETEDDLVRQVAEHAATAHGVKEVTPELAARVKTAIRTR
jgi:predicted small metal-binding protein